MTNGSKLLSESKSKCNKNIEEGYYKTSRKKYERERKL